MRRPGTAIDRARERFLGDGALDPDCVDGVVRREIADSWQRSLRAGVDATRLEVPYTTEVDVDGRLASCARPVLDQLEQQLSGTAVGVVLTDADGRLLDRRVGAGELRRRLDDICLAPGFSYAEAHAGTNGVGTALEGAASALVVGAEHFTDRLQAFACAGAPVHHPVSRRLVGIVDVTCLEAEANSLMSVLAVQAARDIEQILAERGSLGAREVMAEFQRVCRRSDHPVVALADDFLIANREAQSRLDACDQEMLRRRAQEWLSLPLAADDRLLLSTGPVRLRHRPVPAVGHPVGVVVEIVPSAATTRLAAAASRMVGWSGPGSSGGSVERTFSGLAGTSASWRSTCGALRAAAARATPTLVIGESGVGKAAAAAAAHRERHPAGRCVVLDARHDDVAAAVGAAGEGPVGQSTSVVVRHLEAWADDALPTDGVAALTDLVATGGPWVVGLVTGTEPPQGPPALRSLVESLGAPIAVEPLRRRSEDVAVLVPALLERLAPSRRVRVGPAAGQLLGGGLWPGNVEQLADVLRGVLAATTGSDIEPDDLPPELGVHGTRRRLSPLEAAERDLIVSALIEANGNRVHAAKALGMGRATLYRRLRAFGITEVGR
jgi:transcriptional regulator of acetoin/glycerol metabolism